MRDVARQLIEARPGTGVLVIALTQVCYYVSVVTLTKHLNMVDEK